MPPSLVRNFPTLHQEHQGAKVFDDRRDQIVWYDLNFFPRTLFGMMRLYNTLPASIRELTSVASFQSDLMRFVRTRAEAEHPSWQDSLNPAFHFVSGRYL